MKWSSAVSDAEHLDAALAETCAAVGRELGERPDLAVLFVSEHHRPGFEEASGAVVEGLAPRVLLGCSAGGVIGAGREVEDRPGVSLTAARLPGVDLRAFALAAASDLHALPPPGAAAYVLLADPFSFDAEAFARALDERDPASVKVGGLASGGRGPGENVLYRDREVLRGGLVGVALSGNLIVEAIVAQGCRPIGEPMFVTACRGNVLRALDGRPPLEVLQDLFARLGPEDRELFRHSLFVGLVMDEARDTYRQGDFLIRNLAGVDAQSGAIAVGAALHEGLVVQFHLRDARTSAADLDALLERRAAEPGRPAGSLLFSCLGRGSHLYGAADHDPAALRRHLGEVPLGGFFCNGEIGPVGGSTFLHGYTSAFGLFRPKDSPHRAGRRAIDGAVPGDPRRRRSRVRT